MDEVERFIAPMRNPGTEDVFLNGYCYHFAAMLNHMWPQGVMMYNPVRCHFALKIEGRLYDITGRIEDDGGWYVWEDWAAMEPDDATRTVEQIILKI